MHEWDEQGGVSAVFSTTRDSHVHTLTPVVLTTSPTMSIRSSKSESVIVMQGNAPQGEEIPNVEETLEWLKEAWFGLVSVNEKNSPQASLEMC